jgi:hypothetical protein
VTFFLTFFTAQYLLNEFERITENSFGLYEAAYLFLLGATILLIGLWFYETEVALDAAHEWLSPRSYRPPISTIETGILFAVLLMLVGLVVAARWVHVYGALLTIYGLSDLSVLRVLKKESRRVIEDSRKDV